MAKEVGRRVIRFIAVAKEKFEKVEQPNII